MATSFNPFQNIITGQASGVSAPRCQVTINGTSLGMPLEVEVFNNSNFECDDFWVKYAIGQLPKAVGLDFFDKLAKDTLVQIGFTTGATKQAAPGILGALAAATSRAGQASFTPLITGQIDDIDIDIGEQMIEIGGRDLSARFIDNKTSETFTQQTSSEVAKLLAMRRGLDSNVQATTTKIGTFYQLQNSDLSNDRTEWDVLVKLAKHENFDVWVSNQALNFLPRLDPSTKPYVLSMSSSQGAPAAGGLLQQVGNLIHPSQSGTGPQIHANFSSLRLTRNLNLASNVVVNVTSYNQAQQTSFTKTWKITKDKSAGAPEQVYNFRHANLTPAAAQAQAQNIAEDLAGYERKISARLPGDLLANTRTPIQVTGTKTSFDQVYYPEKITRRLDQHGGFVMDITAKNHSAPISEDDA